MANTKLKMFKSKGTIIFLACLAVFLICGFSIALLFSAAIKNHAKAAEDTKQVALTPAIITKAEPEYLIVPELDDYIATGEIIPIAIRDFISYYYEELYEDIMLLCPGNCYAYPKERNSEFGYQNEEISEKMLANHSEYLLKETENRKHSVLLPQYFDPFPREFSYGANTESIYIEAVRDYLATKGIKNIPIIIQEVLEADLDGSGNIDAIIIAENIPDYIYSRQPEKNDNAQKLSDLKDITYQPGMCHYRAVLFWQKDQPIQEIYYNSRDILRNYDDNLLYVDIWGYATEEGYDYEYLEDVYLYDNDGNVILCEMRGISDDYGSGDYSYFDYYYAITGIADLDNDGNMEVIFERENYYLNRRIYRLENNCLTKIYSSYSCRI
ncbi:MAG: hypothetical protein FWG61_03110 [Firmicutes bacterium]|nr:hypothetical protein [Bacillota bacterium]